MNENFDYFKKIYLLLDGHKKYFFLVVISYFFLSLIEILSLSLIFPYMSIISNNDLFYNSEFYKFIISLNINFFKNNLFEKLTFIILIVFFIKFILSLTLNYLVIYFTNKHALNLRDLLYSKSMNIRFESFIKINPARILFIIKDQVQRFQILVQFLFSFIGDFIVALFIFLLLIFISGFEVLLAFIIFSLSAFLFDYIFKNKLYQIGKKNNEFEARMIKSINQSLDGFKEIRLSNLFNFFKNEFNYNSSKNINLRIKQSFINTIPRYFLELIIVFFVVSLIIYSYYKNNLISNLPIIGVYAFAFFRLLPIFNRFIVFLTNYRSSKNSINLIHEFYHQYDDLNSLDKIQKEHFFNNLVFKNVSFKYQDTNHLIFDNLNFELKKNDIIGLKGSSGIGKSTFLNLLVGLLKPTSGKILLNDKDEIYNTPYSKLVGYLPQDAFIIDDNLFSNIALGQKNQEYDIEKIDKLISLTKLDSLKDGIDNLEDKKLGNRGVQISGGQRQRVVLARSIYFGKDILILDESTSALDLHTEEALINEIIKLFKDKTIIIVSHRLDLYKYCNKVYQIKDKTIKKIEEN